ncbi:MAG: isochorismatase family protein [Tissierellia bacterium]|nr:isochorismatase family protein [Tissierellia bacterium]
MKNFELKRENTLFLFVDIQDSLLDAVFNKELVFKNAKTLAMAAKIMDIESIVTLQYPKGLGNMNEEIYREIENPITVEKLHFSCVKDENFMNKLNELNKKQIVLLGIEAHVCCLQTARDLINSGFEVFCVNDALGSRAKENYENALDMLKDMGCVVTNTESVLFDLLIKAGGEEFKSIHKLIK